MKLVLFSLWMGAFLITTSEACSKVAKEPTTEPDLICCGANEVFVIDSKTGQTKWSWFAKDSKTIPLEYHRLFRTTDECKPYGKNHLLITSSSGGVALVRRSDKKCLFYATATNAHSACLLPQKRIAVAASTGGDQVMIFNRLRSATPPIAQIPLKGAHGVHWDNQRQCLWALGEDELLKCRIKNGDKNTSLEVTKRWPLPSHGGHDLSPTPDHKFFYITTNSNIHQFDLTSHQFSVFKPLQKHHKVKSIDQYSPHGPIVFHQANKDHWWSDTIRFVGSERVIQLTKRRLYKIRWDYDNSVNQFMKSP